MRIAETLNEGLKREYTLVIPAADVAKRIDAQVATVAARIRMPGFRPGKVPHNLVRKMHGDQLRAEALSEAVQAGVTQLITDQKLRPAMQPSVDLTSADADKDVELKVAMEVLPTFETSAVDGIALEKLVVEPTDAEVEEALNRLAGQQKRFESAAGDHAAARGDVVVMDFVGTVDGEPFDGGKGEGMQIELGSGRLIPGFEDQLEGVKAGEDRTVSVTFPDDYNVPYLKGRAAEFAVTVTEVRTAADIAIDDELAKGFGVEDLEKLKQLLKEQLAGELASLSRTHLKRKLLDHLAATNDFAVPDAMVEAEFTQIWTQLEQEAARDADPDKARIDMEAERDDYRRIAERRVRLGLLLSEIGQSANVQISQAEMNRLIAQEASRFPGQQQQVVKYFQENAMAAAQLRAPLYEEKVVDHILGKAVLTERTVTREELQAAIESEDETPTGHVHGPGCGHDHGHDHDHDHARGAAGQDTAPAKAKPARAKKAKDEPASETAAAEEAKPAAKPRARKKAAGEGEAAE